VNVISTLSQGGETLVFVSSGQVGPALGGRVPVPGWVPLPARREEPLVLTLQQEGATQYTVSGHLPQGTLLETEAFYRTTLVEQGWDVEGIQHPSSDETQFQVRLEGTRGVVVLRRVPEASGVQVLLSLLQRT
jgi:hypothetical protein